MFRFLLLSLLCVLSTSDGQTTESVESVTIAKVIITSTEPSPSFTVNCSLTDVNLLANVHFLQMKLLIDGLGSRNTLAVWEKYQTFNASLRTFSTALQNYSLNMTANTSADRNLNWFTFTLMPSSDAAFGDYFCRLEVIYQNGSLLDEHSSELKLEKPKTTTPVAALTVKRTTEPNNSTSGGKVIPRRPTKNLTWLWIVLGFSAIGGLIYCVHLFIKYSKNRVKGVKSREYY